MFSCKAAGLEQPAKPHALMHRAVSSIKAIILLFITLSFHGTGGKTVHEVFYEAEIENNDGNRDEYGACREAREMRFRQTEKPHCDSPEVSVLEKELGKKHIAPRPCKLGEHGIDYHGFA